MGLRTRIGQKSCDAIVRVRVTDDVCTNWQQYE
jgi:hypothetical protein